MSSVFLLIITCKIREIAFKLKTLISFEYPGMRRQCNNCYGPHAKKYCRSERVGMENFVKGFSTKYDFVPREFYGKLASHVMNNGSSTSTENLLPNIQQAVQGPPTAKAMSQPPGKDQTGKTTSRLKILISLKRNSGETWSSSQHQPETVKDAVLPPATSPACPAPTTCQPSSRQCGRKCKSVPKWNPCNLQARQCDCECYWYASKKRSCETKY